MIQLNKKKTYLRFQKVVLLCNKRKINRKCLGPALRIKPNNLKVLTYTNMVQTFEINGEFDLIFRGFSSKKSSNFLIAALYETQKEKNSLSYISLGR